MGYLVKKQQRRARVRRPEAMGGWIDTVLEIGLGQPGKDALDALRDRVGQEAAMECLTKANASESVAAIDAEINRLNKTWKPSGYYSPEQVEQIIAQIIPLTVTARAAMANAPSSTSDAASATAQFDGAIARRLEAANVFHQAVIKARTDGVDVIDAPGLRLWVLFALAEISTAMVHAFTLTCMEGFLDVLYKWITKFGQFLMSLAEIVVKAGQLVLKIPDTISTLWTVVKWTSLVGAAYFIYTEILKPRMA